MPWRFGEGGPRPVADGRWYVTKPCNDAVLVWCGERQWIWEDEALKTGRGALQARFFATAADAQAAFDCEREG
jgi:hypothetical protein